MVPTIELLQDSVKLIDQRKLPEQLAFIQTNDYRIVAHAIRTLAVRGAPAIGIAAAFGLVLAARELHNDNTDSWLDGFQQAADELRLTRPTAVNLFWAIDRMVKVATRESAKSSVPLGELEQEARAILAEDLRANTQMGSFGATLFPENARVLTHCNAGALATGGVGTALGVIRAAHRLGRVCKVWADETRPLLQGARLTAWELQQDGIDVRVITDNMAAHLMQHQQVDLVIVGADRIAANGDTANKIGTYGLAVLCHYHHIPLYIAAPTSTVDLTIKSGTFIPIEERSEDEVTHLCGRRTVPVGVPAYNPAFDVTPAALIAAIITEKGVLEPPFADALNNACRAGTDRNVNPAGH